MRASSEKRDTVTCHALSHRHACLSASAPIGAAKRDNVTKSLGGCHAVTLLDAFNMGPFPPAPCGGALSREIRVPKILPFWAGVVT